MKIVGDNKPNYDVHKTMTTVMAGNPNAFIDVTPAMTNMQVKPQLLTALIGGSFSTNTLITNAFQFDMITRSLALPDGKAYSDKGKDLTKDGSKSKWFDVPSFGLRWNTAPEDYINKRKPGTTEMMDEVYVNMMMQEKSSDAWSLFGELAINQLLTTDTNIVRDGPFTEYNYYTDLIGSTRPAAVDMDLDGATDHEAAFRKQKHLLTEKIMMAGYSASNIRFVCICGDTFFNERYDIERASGLAREIRNSLDAASMPIPTQTFGNDSYNYDNFVGNQDGIWYINYGASIIAGTKLIADTAGYLLPLGIPGWLNKAFAPARTRTYANTEALEMYSWTNEDEWQGITSFYEKNILYFNSRPEFIVHLKNT